MRNRRLSSRLVYEGRIIRLRLDEVELPDGNHAEREVIEHPGAAAIVPIDNDGKLRLVSQYRDAVGEELLEIPAGKLKPDELPETCARRELREELRLEAGRMTPLATFYSTPGFCDEVMHVFLAEELARVEPDPGREEFITERIMPLEPLGPLIEVLRDGKSIAGIMMAYERRRASDGA